MLRITLITFGFLLFRVKMEANSQVLSTLYLWKLKANLNPESDDVFWYLAGKGDHRVSFTDAQNIIKVLFI